MNKPHFSRKSRGGFTLVEVVISMGIMIVTLVPMLGLMANGLTQLGSNLDKNQAVNICQQVFVAAQQQSFSALAQTANAGSTTTTYFSAEGDVVPSGSANIVYTANIKYTASVVTASTTPPMVTLAIKILKTPGGNVPTNAKPIASFVGTVSCSDISGYNAGTD